MKKFDLKFYCSHHHDLKQKQIKIALVHKLSKQHYIIWEKTTLNSGAW